MNKLKSEVLQKAVAITSMFEGGNGYSNVTGDFDGQGMSYGFLQWCFGQGSLQPLFQKLFDEHSDIAQNILPEGGWSLKQALADGTCMKWASQIQSGNQVQEPWYTALYNLGQTEEMKQIENEFAQPVIDRAINMCNSFNLTTDRAFCLFFDIATQNGSLQYYDMAETEYMDKLKSIATVVADRSNSQWRDDVYKRKMAIVLSHDQQGRGWDNNIIFNDCSAFDEDSVINEGYDIAEIQTQFNNLGYNVAVDGVVGNCTLNALHDFKSKHGLEVNDYIDKWTVEAIYAAVAELNTPQPQQPQEEVRDLNWKEILQKVSANPAEWENGINAAVNAANADGGLGDLEIFKFLPALIEKIYNSK